MHRVLFAFVVGAVAGVTGVVLAQSGRDDGKGPEVKTLSAVDIAEEVAGKPVKATTIELTFPPGAAGTPHRHPCPVFGYVLEGELEFAVGEEEPHVLKAGDTFYEPTMILHAVSRNPSATAKTRVLAILIHPRDVTELAIPEPSSKPR